MIYFTSDTHESHPNITGPSISKWKSGYRNFESIHEMNKTLVSNINSVVGEDDILIHLGDWSFGGFDNIAKFRNLIKCKNVHLILGNHDNHILKNKDNIQSIFSSVKHNDVLEYAGYKIIMQHYPPTDWIKKDNEFFLHGHCHNNLYLPGWIMDVGVDNPVCNFSPISIDRVVEYLIEKTTSELK